MHETKKAVLLVISRVCIALLFFVVSWIMVSSIDTSENSAFSYTIIVKAVSGAILVVVGSIILGPVFARYLSLPAGFLYNPGRCARNTIPQLSIARAKQRKGLFEEALLEYQKIAEHFPEDTRIYTEMMSIAVENLRDVHKLEDIYGAAKSRLCDEKDLCLLTRNFTEGKEWLSSCKI
jgi:hypothetical protein